MRLKNTTNTQREQKTTQPHKVFSFRPKRYAIWYVLSPSFSPRCYVPDTQALMKKKAAALCGLCGHDDAELISMDHSLCAFLLLTAANVP